MVTKHADAAETQPFSGARRRILSRGGALMLVEVRFDKGIIVEPHAHRHEQTTYIVSGRIVVSIDGQDHELGPGDSFYAAPNVPHGVRILENAVLTDCFTPQREDFLR